MPQKPASRTEELPYDQVIRNKKNEKLVKKKTDEVANLLADSLLNKMGMSQDVRVTELNEARHTEEIVLSDNEKEDTNFKEAIKGVPKQSGTDSEASQQTS